MGLNLEEKIALHSSAQAPESISCFLNRETFGSLLQPILVDWKVIMNIFMIYLNQMQNQIFLCKIVEKA